MNATTRPRFHPPVTAIDRVLQTLGLAGAAALVALLLGGESLLPDRVPLHFDAAGQPNRWGAPGELLLVPVVGLVLYGLLTLFARVPHHYNYPWEITAENAPRQYALARRLVFTLRAAVVWIFVALLWGTGRVATGSSSSLGPWFLVVALSATLVPIVVYLLIASSDRDSKETDG